jgi:hypothetical protein
VDIGCDGGCPSSESVEKIPLIVFSLANWSMPDSGICRDRSVMQRNMRMQIVIIDFGGFLQSS